MTQRGGQVEHARLVAKAAPRTSIERENDQALEYAIFWTRLGGPVAVLAGVASLVAWIWTGDWRWVATAALAAVVGGVASWWGWWEKGNEEWRTSE